MAEQKEFKKKELNKDDYKKDKNIVGGIKKVGEGLLAVAVVVGGVIKFLPNLIKKD